MTAKLKEAKRKPARIALVEEKKRKKTRLLKKRRHQRNQPVETYVS
jgi:hypothetical protein